MTYYKRKERDWGRAYGAGDGEMAERACRRGQLRGRTIPVTMRGGDIGDSDDERLGLHRLLQDVWILRCEE